MSLTTDSRLYHRLFPVLQYIQYYLKKEDRHSLQSPFSYRVYQGLKEYLKKNIHGFPILEQKRKTFLEDGSKIRVEDLGAGSKRFSSEKRKIQDILKFSCSSQKYSLLYQYFCSLTPAQTVIELGSCLGLNTCYLAEVTKGSLYSFEGAEGLVHLLEKNVDAYKNIRLITGDITETLPIFLQQRPMVDFAFIDANHTYRYTLRYYHEILDWIHPGSVIVIADIHWSIGMNKAWEEIIASDKVRLSMDFYECGVLFFKKGLEKNHHILHY